MASVSAGLYKVMVVFGTRPEAIKMAPVVHELRRHPDRFHVQVAVTAQHREMLDQVLHLFQIRPDFDLDIMKQGQSLKDVTVRVLSGMEELFALERPDVVLVQGDTTTTFATSLAAFYQRIPVGHVEAGLRTGNRYDPFPEEINRRLTTPLAGLHFAPTGLSRQNLLNEGVPEDVVFLTGNTVIDALLSVIQPSYAFKSETLQRAVDRGRRLILVTTHRRENLGEPMRRIYRAIRRLVDQHQDVEVVFAVHRNPAVRELAQAELGGIPRVLLIDPPDYEEFANLMATAALILTDSGGVQEEAPSLGKPVLVLRETTERPEGVQAGTLRLIGTQEDRVVAEADRLLRDPAAYAEMAQAANPYGDGQASQRIAQALLAKLGTVSYNTNGAVG